MIWPFASGGSVLHDLPEVDQRREVESNHIHLQLHALRLVDDGLHDGILNLPVVKVHPDFITDVKFARGWVRLLRYGWIIRQACVRYLVVLPPQFSTKSHFGVRGAFSTIHNRHC